MTLAPMGLALPCNEKTCSSLCKLWSAGPLLETLTEVFDLEINTDVVFNVGLID
jgi:hypothetical protein